MEKRADRRRPHPNSHHQPSTPPLPSWPGHSAVGLAASGAAYIGVNLEFAGAPLSQSVHAEQFLAANLLLHGERRLRTLAVSAAPCGHCRQFYSELADAVRRFSSHSRQRRGARSEGWVER